ncbi:unnamed protein product [Owenia fusiformis]|uniref:Uncharacterized protein n=1 Tax=Owenia fusiformis TaxID=6347 RepID=A0A8J1UXT3_OWEFU|nr:unnamed protein product [Owenia fusiformis]
MMRFIIALAVLTSMATCLPIEESGGKPAELPASGAINTTDENEENQNVELDKEVVLPYVSKTLNTAMTLAERAARVNSNTKSQIQRVCYYYQGAWQLTEGQSLHFLDRHRVKCDPGQYLVDWRLGGERQGGGSGSRHMRMLWHCCTI